MGKNMYARHHVNNEVENSGYHPGCISGFMYAIDYHHWNYNVKKMIKDKKYEGKRHAKGTINPQTRLILDDPNELQQFSDEDESCMLDNQKAKYTHLTKKRSLKARIKGLIAKDAKQQNGAKQKRGSSPKLLLRTYSIHHREPSDRDLREVCKDEKQAIVFVPGSLDEGKRSMKVPNGRVQSDMPSMNNASQYRIGKNEDILEIFKVNKDLYLEIVKNADENRKLFLKTLQNLDTKVRLTKSGSFPTADLSGRRNLKPSKLEHKKSEIWISPGEERFLENTRLPELAVLKFKNHLRSKSCRSSYDIDYSMTDQNISSNFQILERVPKKDGGEMDFLRESQQSAEVEAREDKSRGSIDESPMDEFSSGYIPPASEKDDVGTNGECVTNRSDESVSTITNDVNQSFLSERAATHRRSSSLTESLDRYNRLYEFSSRQEVKLNLSKSLKLRNEYDLPSGGQISFRRIHSLSHHDFWYPFQNEEPRDAHYEDWTTKSIVENNSVVERDAQTEEICLSDPEVADDKLTVDISNTVENVACSRVNLFDEDIIEADDLIEKINSKAAEKHVTFREEDTGYSEIDIEGPTKSIPDLNSGVLGEASPAHFSEGPKNISNHIDQNDPPVTLEQMASVEPLSRGETNLENLEDVERDIMNCGNSEFHKTDDEDLIYVSGLLELSSISWDAVSDATWHLLDQPLNRSVLEELETYWHAESEFSKEAVYSCSHHRLLFDLVNEELMQMHKRSFTYYPKALSSRCRIRPLQVGKQISEEVSHGISKMLNRKPERYQTLDNILSQDLKENDGWFNLQLDSECVALELESMIFDELLEEILCA